jgi:TRAP-type C4-dicarboxylate transport system permease small subunit
MAHSAEATQTLGKTSSFDKLVFKISQTMSAIGAVMFAAMMVVTVIDVGGRALASSVEFIKPMVGAVELIGFMLVLGGTWGMGYCQLLRMHIRINILVEKWPSRVQSFFWGLTCLISLASSALIAWQAYVKTGVYLTTTLGSKSATLGAPLWPFILMMAIGFTWVGFILLIDFIKSVRGVVKP